MGKVTDPSLLAALESDAPGKVSDPALLAQLEGGAPPPTPQHPMYETALAHAAQGAVLGGAPTIMGLMEAGGGSRENPSYGLGAVADVASGIWHTLTGDKKAIEAKKAAADKERAYLDELARANPKTAIGAQVLGGAPAAAMVAPAAAATTFLGRAGQAGMTGAKLGVLSGAARSDTLADVPGNVGKDATVGLVAGPLLQGGIEGTGALLRAPVNALRRSLALQPTPSAQLLESQGVPLTVGQKAPNSTLGTIERASADNPFGMAPQRKANEQAFMRAAQNKGVAPGASSPASPDIQDRLKTLLGGFDEPYGQIGRQPIPPEAIASLPKAAAMPRRGVDARTAEGVKAEVENALSVLGPEFKPPSAGHGHHGHGAAPEAKPPALLDPYGREIPPTPPPPAPPPKATAGDLLKVRENIRENIRKARTAQDFDRIDLLERAEDVVTGAIEKGLTPESAQLLRDTDRQYARLMTAVNAAPAGQTEFTPLQYLKQVEKGAGRRAFKQGGAGDLQDLGEAARETFANAPMTGVRPGILSFLPGAKMWGAPVARLANSRAGQRFLFTPPAAAASRPVSPQVAAMIAALERQASAAQLAQAAADQDRTGR